MSHGLLLVFGWPQYEYGLKYEIAIRVVSMLYAKQPEFVPQPTDAH